MPLQLNIASDLSGDFSPMTSAEWTIQKDTNLLTITFLEEHTSTADYRLTLTTSLRKITALSEETQRLTFNTTPTQTVYQLQTESSTKSGTMKTNLTIDPLNPQTAKIESQFNLDRTDKSNRSFKVAADMYPGSLSIKEEDVKVYTSDVDFDGMAVGEKTLLSQGVDYDWINVNKVDTKRADT